MRQSLLRRALAATALGTTLAGALLATSVAPAAAATDPTLHVVAATGSDTTENFMKDYLAGKTTSTNGVNTYTNVQTYNIPAFPKEPGFQVPDDGNCTAVAATPTFPGGTINWRSSQVISSPSGQNVPAPSGSGAGRARLLLEKTNNRGCIDIGRSSSKGAETGLEYYAFGLDAVTWASPSVKAPAFLTRQQVKDIFLCNIKDWGDVGGVPGPIQRYVPQSGSGTRSVFESEFLDSVAYPTGVAGCPDVKVIDKDGKPFEENQGNTIADADIDKAILPYSAGVWAFQKNNSTNPSLDKRNNVKIGGLKTVTGSVIRNALRWNTDGVYELDFVNGANPTGVVTDQNTSLINAGFSKVNGFSGVRLLFNVVDVSNTLTYGPAVGLVGFDNIAAPTYTSPLCNNDARDLILTYGFAPLSTTTSAKNLSGSTCRKFDAP